LALKIVSEIIYELIKFTNLTKNIFITNTLLINSKYNPIYTLFLNDKINYYKLNHLNKIVEIQTISDKKYIGQLKYVMDNLFIRIANSYIKYEVIKNIKLSSMYHDIYNYRVLNLKDKFRVHIPNEINDIIESYIFDTEIYRSNKNRNMCCFSTTEEFFSGYILYGEFTYA
tara:strand:- start:5774 stop:6286 length:513 start_codon:yes stop_codon:yes gene_type:complete